MSQKRGNKFSRALAKCKMNFSGVKKNTFSRWRMGERGEMGDCGGLYMGKLCVLLILIYGKRYIRSQ